MSKTINNAFLSEIGDVQLEAGDVIVCRVEIEYGDYYCDWRWKSVKAFIVLTTRALDGRLYYDFMTDKGKLLIKEGQHVVVVKK